MEMTKVKVVEVIVIGAVLCMGMAFGPQSLGVDVDFLEGMAVQQSYADHSFDTLRHFAMQDGILALPGGGKGYGYTETPAYEPLEIHQSNLPGIDYMATSPYYKVFFTDASVKMTLKDCWIEFELKDKGLGEKETTLTSADQNKLLVSNAFESMDLSYTVDVSLMTETLTLKKPKEIERIQEGISWGGMSPEFQEDGSIVFQNEKGKAVLKILPPFMEDALGSLSTGLHYELLKTDTGYELHKAIDEEGEKWLKEALFPVIIDPSMQIFEDAWESSGLQPYGQYFQNLREYVNPANGHLTITQTDLQIPGRGLDLAISRVYEVPAVFYGSDPYDYESPLTDVGKGWQLDIPYIGSKYVHLWGGTIFKIVWTENQYVNVRGKNFTLIKNGDNTYTLTLVNGTTYEFDTSGRLTYIKDIDLNTITFTYTEGKLTSISDTIGRTATFTYSNDRLWKITYNGSELEYSYDSNGCLVWMEDFLNRRTTYSYDTGYNYWLLSSIEYPTEGYTTYAYDRFSDNDYYKYYVTDQTVYDTSQVRHTIFSYTGDFESISHTTVTTKNESDVTRGSYELDMDEELTVQISIKNSSGTAIRKHSRVYNSNYDMTAENIYNDGSSLSYTNYYAYDDWGNIIYIKDAEGHEKFFSFANTSTSGYFVDNNGTVIRTFSNAFSNNTVPSSVHNALLGMGEKQDSTYVREIYVTYDSEAHATENNNSFGNATTWLTFSGTFNEQTSNTSFSVDLTGHAVAGNGVLQITGLASDSTYLETHSFNCTGNCDAGCKGISGSWSGEYYNLNYQCCIEGMGGPSCGGSYDTSIGSFYHEPGSLGYVGYYTEPGLGEIFSTFNVKTQWKAYPVQVQYNLDQSSWKAVAENLENSTATKAVPITAGSHTLYFSESSAQNTKFSWTLWVPVDSSLDTYTSSMAYDTYGNMTSITDPESNTTTLAYSSDYSYAYQTQVSRTAGNDTITLKVTYDYNRGWIASLQEPKGVDSGSGYDYLYTYDVLGRITKKEFPLLSGQSQRSYLQAVYDCENRTTTIIDQLGHYVVQQYDMLGRHTDTKWYTGTYGQGTLYATVAFTYQYDNLLKTATDPGNHTTTYTYDFLGRQTSKVYPDLSSVSYSYDDASNKTTLTNERGFDRTYWYDWLDRVTEVEEEYAVGQLTDNVYQYNELGNLIFVTDGENHTTGFDYASLFGLTGTTYPDSAFEEYEYDNMGNIALFTDANGGRTQYIYDDWYRLTEVKYRKSDNWTYYKQISINNFSSDYQYRITVHKGSGTDDAANVYLNNHCQDDFDDIRFRESDKTTELDHYRESYTSGSSAVFWVELPASEQSIYIFYDNTAASSASNGENTFIFFDDCESGTPTATWTENDQSYGDISYVSGSGEYKYGENGLKITQTSTSDSYVVNANFEGQTNFVVDIWKKQVGDVSYLRVGDSQSGITLCRLYWSPDDYLKWYDNATYVSTGYTWSSDWEHHELICTASNDTVVWERNGAEIEDDAHEDSWSEGHKLDIFVGAKLYPGSTYLDNIYVRKYEATPPTFAFSNETENEGQVTIASFTYDLNSNRTRMDDDAPGTGDYVEYTYDNWNRLTAETRHISQNTYTVSYEYDVASNISILTYPDAMQIVYSYDDLNRVTEIKRYVDGSNDEILLDNVQYTSESLLTQFDYGNDLHALLSYDTRDRLSTFEVKNGETHFLNLRYTYDDTSNITQLTDGWRDTSSTWHSETESYSYDGLDRLTSGSCTSWSHTYSYDKAGNRTARDSVTYTVNTVNEVTALSDGTSFTYDDMGNRTEKSKGTDSWTYTYDYASRLTKVEKNSAVLGEYAYDGDGKRIQVTENSVTTTYIRYGLNVLYEENSNGSASYVYGPQGVLAKRTTVNEETTTFFYHLDNLGSVRLVTDDEKNIVVSAAYHPFGETSVQEGSERYLFTGKEKDITELYYYGARYYDPEIGRFLTRDTYTFLPNDSRLRGSAWGNRWLENSQALNRYTYALNNPLRYNDPTGLLPKCCDDECEYLCESNDETHSRTGNSTICDEEGYPLPPSKTKEPEKPEDPDKKTSTEAYCDECTCMENEDVKELIKEKRIEKYSSYANIVIGAVFCGVFGFGVSLFGGPLGFAMGLVCTLTWAAGTILQNKEIQDRLFDKFAEADCVCGYNCADR